MTSDHTPDPAELRTYVQAHEIVNVPADDSRIERILAMRPSADAGPVIADAIHGHVPTALARYQRHVPPRPEDEHALALSLARPDRAAHDNAILLSLASQLLHLAADYNPHTEPDRFEYVLIITNTAIIEATSVAEARKALALAARTTTGPTFLLLAEATDLIPR